MARLNIEAFLVSYLKGSVANVQVRTRVPKPRPERLIVVKRSGGARLNVAQDRPGVHLLIYGGSESETSALAGEVADRMDDLNRSDAAMLAGVSRVVEESLRSDPDTEAKPEVPRWFASYTITTHCYD